MSLTSASKSAGSASCRAAIVGIASVSAIAALACLALAPPLHPATPPASAAPAMIPSPAPAGDLARLEQAVAAAPNDLRAHSEYRQAVIAAKQYDRAIDFYEKLATAHPESANVFLNWGYAYVDKIPDAGAVTQVILANTAVTHFTQAIERERGWLALYTRGNSYLYWPAIFGRAPLAVADLEAAIRLSEAGPRRSYYVHAWVALGDGYVKIEQPDRARATWSEGLKLFPGDADLAARLGKQGEELKAYVASQHDHTQRVDTSLREIWSQP
jgi:tetratricopeptide (TPR) repeat protein